MHSDGHDAMRNPSRRTPRAFLFAALCCLTGVGACASGGGPPLESVAFAPALAVSLDRMESTRSGVRYEDIRVGTGAVARAGGQVAVHFVGWLADGTQFDGAAPPSEPVRFQLGRRQVIRGWDEGIPGMRVGGQRRIVVPASLGYGAQRVGAVPAHSALVFVVELVDAS